MEWERNEVGGMSGRTTATQNNRYLTAKYLQHAGRSTIFDNILILLVQGGYMKPGV